MALLLAVLVLSICAAGAVPVEQTRYGRSALRLEVRPELLWFSSAGVTMDRLESTFAGAGVQSRWLSVVDPLGNPEYQSSFIPTTLDKLDQREKALKEWVAAIHRQGMAAMSWYPLIISQSGAQLRPEWRQGFLIDDPPGGKHRGWECCFNTGYGDALIEFCNEAIDKFGLDGIWFDGSAWTQIWDRPLPLTCNCAACTRLFKEQTGLELPRKVNWSDSIFRRWVAWRYESFGSYIGRLAAGIRRKHPNAAVVINHYHRPVIPWQGAIPLNPYDADIISGSEAHGEGNADLTTRLCRAYGRSQAEVWMPLTPGAEPETAPETDALIHHALTCVTAGGMPSYGTGPDFDAVPKTAKHVAGILNKLRPYVCSQSVAHAAVLVSQQTETFYFSRDTKGLDWSMEPFWQSLMTWTQGLMEAHIPPDYIYDKQLNAKTLARYRVLILPLALALSEAQCRYILAFARNGGVVLLGPGAGAADEWGEKRGKNVLEEALGFSFKAIPSYAANERSHLALLRGEEPMGVANACRYPLELRDPSWERLYSWVDSDGKEGVAAAMRPFGKGRVMVCGVDFRSAWREWQPVDGGGTSISVSSETSASGKQSLRFVDSPNAPQSFYPDLEVRFQPFGAPEATEGRLSCALRLGSQAIVCIECRSSAPKHGPSLHIGKDGKLWARDKALCDVPLDKWFRVDVRFRLIGENRAYDVTMDVPGEEAKVFRNLPYIDADFDRCDWAVIYGEATQGATFYLDDLKIESVSSGQTSTSVHDDFESLTDDLTPTAGPVTAIVSELSKLAPAPVELDGPANVRMGVFRKNDAETVVHLHNIRGTRRASRDTVPVTLRVRMPITSATLALSGEKLEVRKQGETSVVRVPGVVLHEVVVLRKDTEN